jgi:hypothetical protein
MITRKNIISSLYFNFFMILIVAYVGTIYAKVGMKFSDVN